MQFKVHFLLLLLFYFGCAFHSEKRLLTEKEGKPNFVPGYLNHANGKVNGKKQKAWISQQIDTLKLNQPIDNIALVSPEITDIPEFKRVSYRLNGKGVILCENGEKIVFSPHSAHHDAEIGDVTIGFVNKTMVYTNTGHICGGIIHFESNMPVLPKTATDFFSRFVSDTDDAAWSRK